MKRLYLIFILVTGILIIVNVSYFIYLYRHYINYQKSILLKQTQLSGLEIEKKIAVFGNELQRIILSKNFDYFFSDVDAKENVSNKLKALFSKYYYLVSVVQIYDNQNKVYKLAKNQENYILEDLYYTRTQKLFQNHESFERRNGEWIYILPSFKADNIIGLNVRIVFDFEKFVNAVFENHNIEDQRWQILLDSDGSIKFHNYPSNKFLLQKKEFIRSHVLAGNEGVLVQTINLKMRKTVL